jgi:hypothetical protein
MAGLVICLDRGPVKVACVAGTTGFMARAADGLRDLQRQHAPMVGDVLGDAVAADQPGVDDLIGVTAVGPGTGRADRGAADALSGWFSRRAIRGPDGQGNPLTFWWWCGHAAALMALTLITLAHGVWFWTIGLTLAVSSYAGQFVITRRTRNPGSS